MITVIKRLAIILGISAIVLYGAFWAYTHPNNPLTLWFVIGVIVLLMVALIGNWLSWFSRPSGASRDSKPYEPSDPIYLELRALFREKLLPLDFQEVEPLYPWRGDILAYTRGQSELSMSRDIHYGNIYFFETSNPNISIYRSFSEGDQFKAEVIDKFEEWLANQ